MAIVSRSSSGVRSVRGGEGGIRERTMRVGKGAYPSRAEQTTAHA